MVGTLGTSPSASKPDHDNRVSSDRVAAPPPAYPHFMHNLICPAGLARGWQRAKRAAWHILRRWACMAPRAPAQRCRSPQPRPAAPPASRSVSPSLPWSARGAGRSPACAARGCCAGAIARRRPTSCCWRRPTCAGAMRPSPTRPPPAASGSPASSPISRDAGRLRSSPPTPPGRARCTASAGCATSMRRDRARPGPWPSSWSASGSATRRRRGAHVWAPEVVGRRVVSWLSHAALLLDGAERKRYAAVMAQPHRPDHLPRGLLAQRARRLSPAPRPDRPRPRRPVHRRPRPPARAIAEAAGSRAGAPNPARRRPPQPQPVRPRRAAARLAAAAPMLCRAPRAARAVAARGHRPHDGDAAPPAPRRRHARALQRHGRHRARRAGHRAGL